MMGGVHTDINGATSLPGLYAAGEVACVSINGANRLGSNSLTGTTRIWCQGGVAQRRCLRAKQKAPGRHILAQMLDENARCRTSIYKNRWPGSACPDCAEEMQRVMETSAGIYRKGVRCKAAEKVDELQERFQKNMPSTDPSRTFNTELTICPRIFIYAGCSAINRPVRAASNGISRFSSADGLSGERR